MVPFEWWSLPKDSPEFKAAKADCEAFFADPANQVRITAGLEDARKYFEARQQFTAITPEILNIQMTI